jgi:transglutaminase-like putative cysteine protease
VKTTIEKLKAYYDPFLVSVSLTKKRLLIIGSIVVAIIVIAISLVVPFARQINFGQVMFNLDQPTVLDAIRANITSYFGSVNGTYSLYDLFRWESAYMRFVNGSLLNRPTDPRGILASGQGKCQEFSILYAAACLSAGYNASLILVINKNNSADIQHAFNEVQFQNGSWVQLDASWNTPKLLIYNDTSVYEDANWWSQVGSGYRMIAFYGNGKNADVTYHYTS